VWNAVIVRIQGRLADRPDVKGWGEKPGDFPAESSQPEVSPLELATKSAISKRCAAQCLTDDLLEKHNDTKHASQEAMRDVKERKSRARSESRTITGGIAGNATGMLAPIDDKLGTPVRLCHLVHELRGRHILIALRQMQGQVFVGP
jgi:hypothetical protein